MNDKEYAKHLKKSARELLDEIGTDTKLEQRIISMIYGFIYRCFQNNEREKGGE